MLVSSGRISLNAMLVQTDSSNKLCSEPFVTELSSPFGDLPVPTPHRLEPLLNPRSVALVGVSERPGSVGAWLLDTFIAGGYQGELFLVNPRYHELAGRPCYPELGALPNVPEMAVRNVGSNRMEALVDQVIELGVPAVTIFDYCDVEDDTEPNLMARLRAKAAQANLLICGGGGMGFYNLDAKLHASYYLSLIHI